MALGGQYGSYKYESPEARALASITAESYDKDQAKNLIKLNNDVAYIAAYMRKMQKGIDEANQNVIQQIQSFINDFIVLLGGGSGGGGLDFGDLRYVIQMIGALLGFNVEGGIGGLLPLNAFSAVWHMLSTYIFPVEQFKDVIAAIVDTLIAQILDIFGEIPIVGEVLQQLAVIIVDLRDGLFGIIDFVNDILNVLTGGLGSIGDIFTGIFDAFSINLDLDFSDPISFLISLVDALFSGPIGFITDLISNIFSFTGFDLSGATDLFSDLFGGLQDIIDQIVGGIGNPVEAISGVIAGINGFIQDVVEGIIYAIRGIPFIGAGIADLIENLTGYRQEVETTQINQQNFQITTITTEVSRKPAWVCRYPISDVTFPELLFMEMPVFGDTGPASAGTAHTHDDGTFTAEIGGQQIAQGEARGGYITISNSTVMDTVGVNAWLFSGTVNNIFVDIFREASDSSLTRIFSSDITSLLSGFTDYVEVQTPGIIVQAGERYMVRVRNASTTVGIVDVICIAQGAGSVDISQRTTDPLETEQTSYTTAQAIEHQNASKNLLWAMLAAKNLSQGDQSFSDDANRATVGPLWLQYSNTGPNQIEIVNNEFNFSGSTTGYQGMIYTRRCASDSNRAEADLHIITAGVGTRPRCGVTMHCNRELSQMVYLGVNDSGAKIYTGSPGAWSEKASHATGGSGHWAIYYDIPSNTYFVEKDGTLTGLEWEDAGNIIDHTEDHRFGGIHIERAVVDFFNTHDGGTVDNWTMSDYVFV